jgi:hypothetical protein
MPTLNAPGQPVQALYRNSWHMKWTACCFATVNPQQAAGKASGKNTTRTAERAKTARAQRRIPELPAHARMRRCAIAAGAYALRKAAARI